MAIGAWTYEDIGRNIHGLTVALFTRGLGWSLEKFELFLTEVRKELRDPKIHAYYPMLVFNP